MKSNGKKRSAAKPKKSKTKPVNVANPALYFATKDELEQRNNIEKRVWEWIVEAEQGFMPDKSFMENQCFITGKMRLILVDWMFNASCRLSLQRETVHLAINVLDRYCGSNKDINREDYQLVGIVCLWIATKLEESHEPRLDHYTRLAHDTYPRKDFARVEKDILKVLNWKLQAPTINTWVCLFLQNNNRYETKQDFVQATKGSFGASFSYLLHHQVMNITEIALRSSKSFGYSYSIIAASAVFIVLSEYRDSNFLSSIVTGYITRQTSECVKWLQSFSEFPRPYIFNKTEQEEKIKDPNYFTMQPYNENLVTHLKTLKDFC